MPPVLLLAAADVPAAPAAVVEALSVLACESGCAIADEEPPPGVCDAEPPLFPLVVFAFDAALLLLDVPDVEAFVALPAEDCEPAQLGHHSRQVDINVIKRKKKQINKKGGKRQKL